MGEDFAKVDGSLYGEDTLYSFKTVLDGTDIAASLVGETAAPEAGRGAQGAKCENYP